MEITDDCFVLCYCAFPVLSLSLSLSFLQCAWLGERVATVNVSKAISNVLLNKEEGNWGPNAIFRFPKEGGTGAIWKGVGKLLPSNKQQYV